MAMGTCLREDDSRCRCPPEDRCHDHYVDLAQQLFTKQGNQSGGTVFTQNQVARSPIVVDVRERSFEFSSILWTRTLIEWGIGGTAKTKRIPAWIHGLNRELRLAFLAGIVDSDGTIDKRGALSVGLANKSLVHDIRDLMIGCGIQCCNVRYGEVAMHRLPNPGRKLFYPFWIFTASSAKQVAEIPFADPLYRERVETNMQRYRADGFDAWKTGINSDEMGFYEVKSITVKMPEMLYDIEVNGGGHNFIADGVIVSNSTFANMGEAREMAYESNIIPTQRIFAATLKKQLLNVDFNRVDGRMRKRPRTLKLGFDTSQVRVLQEDENKKVERLNLGVQGGWVRVAEARRSQDLTVNEFDEVYLRNPAQIEVQADEKRPEPEPEETGMTQDGNNSSGQAADKNEQKSDLRETEIASTLGEEFAEALRPVVESEMKGMAYEMRKQEIREARERQYTGWAHRREDTDGPEERKSAQAQESERAGESTRRDVAGAGDANGDDQSRGRDENIPTQYATETAGVKHVDVRGVALSKDGEGLDEAREGQGGLEDSGARHDGMGAVGAPVEEASHRKTKSGNGAEDVHADAGGYGVGEKKTSAQEVGEGNERDGHTLKGEGDKLNGEESVRGDGVASDSFDGEAGESERTHGRDTELEGSKQHVSDTKRLADVGREDDAGHKNGGVDDASDNTERSAGADTANGVDDNEHGVSGAVRDGGDNNTDGTGASDHKRGHDGLSHYNDGSVSNLGVDGSMDSTRNPDDTIDVYSISVPDSTDIGAHVGRRETAPDGEIRDDERIRERGDMELSDDANQEGDRDDSTGIDFSAAETQAEGDLRDVRGVREEGSSEDNVLDGDGVEDGDVRLSAGYAGESKVVELSDDTTERGEVGDNAESEHEHKRAQDASTDAGISDGGIQKNKGPVQGESALADVDVRATTTTENAQSGHAEAEAEGERIEGGEGERVDVGADTTAGEVGLSGRGVRGNDSARYGDETRRISQTSEMVDNGDAGTVRPDNNGRGESQDVELSDSESERKELDDGEETPSEE